MNSRIGKYILIASLSFNIAFVSMGIYKKFLGKEKLQTDTEKGTYLLELNKEKQTDVKEIIDGFKKKMVGFRSRILDKRIDIVQELGNPEFTVESIESKLKELNEIENEINGEFVNTLIKISDILEQTEWLKFLYNLSRDWFFSGIRN